MKSSDIQRLFDEFETVAEHYVGVECWSARNLQALLGYTKWENFSKVVDKAKDACVNVGQRAEDHFPDVRKMVEIGSGLTMLVERGIRPETLPPAEDVKKVERRLKSEEKKALKPKGDK